MRVAFFIKSLHNASGGAEKIFCHVVNKLSKFYKITVFTLDDEGSQSFYPLCKNIEIVYFPKNKLQKIGVIKSIFKIRKWCNANHVEHLVCFMHSVYIPAGFIFIGSKTKIIASDHIVNDHFKERRLEWFLLQLSIFFLEKITVVSEQAKSAYSLNLQRKMVVMPNPINISLRNFSKQNYGSQTILAVGRLEEQKNFETLILAFSNLAKSFPDWQLKIIGEGSKRNFLNELIEKKGLLNKVFLLGRSTNVERFYSESSIFAISSLYESFGLVVVEAKEFQLPVIGFDNCKGVNLLIRNGVNGILVDGSGDRITSLTKGLEKLMRSQTLREKLGRKQIFGIEKYESDRIIQKWVELLGTSPC